MCRLPPTSSRCVPAEHRSRSAAGSPTITLGCPRGSAPARSIGCDALGPLTLWITGRNKRQAYLLLPSWSVPMRRSLLLLLALLIALPASPASAQSRSQLGPLCTTETTPAEQMIDACNKIIALKVFSGAQLATIHFWRAVGWNKKGDYAHVIADASEALRLAPAQAIYNLRGSAYYDKGEYEIAIADFNDALRSGPPSGTIFHNRGNAYRGTGDYAKAVADYDQAVKLMPKSALS